MIGSLRQRRIAMATISANHLKTQGVSAIAQALEHAPEASVSVRGKERFVVMDIEHYRYLRECELSACPRGEPGRSRGRPLRQGNGRCSHEAPGQARVTYVLIFTEQYNRRAARFLKRQPEVREQYRKTLLLLQAEPASSFAAPARAGREVQRSPLAIDQSLVPHYDRLHHPRTADRPDQRRRSRRRLPLSVCKR